MARLPDIRTNYSADAAHLLRLAKAVERDTKRPQSWRENMISKLNDLATDFLNAPSAK